MSQQTEQAVSNRISYLSINLLDSPSVLRPERWQSSVTQEELRRTISLLGWLEDYLYDTKTDGKVEIFPLINEFSRYNNRAPNFDALGRSAFALFTRAQDKFDDNF